MGIVRSKQGLIFTIFSRCNTIRKKIRSNCSCYYFLFEQKTVKRSVQCHDIPQSPPVRHHNDQNPVNTPHPQYVCKNVSLHCDLLATVCTQSDMWIYMHYSSQYRQAGWAKVINKFGTAVNAAFQGKFSACHFGHACHRFDRTALNRHSIVFRLIWTRSTPRYI